LASLLSLPLCYTSNYWAQVESYKEKRSVVNTLSGLAAKKDGKKFILLIGPSKPKLNFQRVLEKIHFSLSKLVPMIGDKLKGTNR
jgi:hypothetical protein